MSLNFRLLSEDVREVVSTYNSSQGMITYTLQLYINGSPWQQDYPLEPLAGDPGTQYLGANLADQVWQKWFPRQM